MVYCVTILELYPMKFEYYSFREAASILFLPGYNVPPPKNIVDLLEVSPKKHPIKTLPETACMARFSPILPTGPETPPSSFRPPCKFVSRHSQVQIARTQTTDAQCSVPKMYPTRRSLLPMSPPSEGISQYQQRPGSGRCSLGAEHTSMARSLRAYAPSLSTSRM